MKTTALTNFIDFFKKPFFTYGIFWSWNFIFIILLIFSEVQGHFLFSIIKNAFVGYTPMDFSIYSLIIFLSPIGSIVLGLTILRKKPLHLMRLFYGVEIPLILLFVLRLSVFKELTSSTTHLFILLFFGILSFLTELLISKDKTPKWLIISQKVGHSLLLIIGVYIGMVLIFYSLPLLWLMISNIFTFGWHEILQAGFFIFLFAIFFIYTATLIVFLPIAIVWLYISAFIRNYKINIPNGKAIVFTTLGINIALLFILNISQPQSFSFDKLEMDFSKSENIQEFNNNSKKIKKGLLNAYLSKYRYISSVKSNNHVEAMYRESFGADGFAEGAQSVYNFIMSPFLYNGSMRKDALKAEEYYEKYFDGNIQKHEKETIIKAMKSTWDSDGIEAGLLNVNQEKVHIEEQEIKINEFNDIAEIEIYEVYKNMTFSRQEIFYYFSLPPNSVITGLWLSDDANNRKKFSFNVSPRGAAQKVYKDEVRRRVDPSLLEQVGPNQYRLRAFPIEPKRKDYMNGRQNGYTIKEGAEFHLSLSYKTLISSDKKWLLPRLSEKRNVYWSKDTRLIVNNGIMDKEDNWLPESVNASSKGNINTHIAKVSDSLFIKMETTKIEKPFNLENRKLSLLIDGSYSMLKENDNLLSILEQLEVQGFKSENMYCFFINESVKTFGFEQFSQDLKTDEVLFFGSTNYMEMISLFMTKQPTMDSDAVLLISDKGNYEASVDSLSSMALNIPLYILHLGEEQAPIYNDAFLETIQNSNGRIILNLDELAQQFNIGDDIMLNQSGIDYSIIDNPNGDFDDNYSELVSKVFIENIRIKNDLNRVKQLDKIHQIALKEQIVTTYSSMIVLVNEVQKAALRKAELEADRFDREVESGNETTSKPSNAFNVSGVPEPHEWIMIFLVSALLLFSYYQKKFKFVR